MRHNSQNDYVASQELKKSQDRPCHKKIFIPVLEPGFFYLYPCTRTMFIFPICIPVLESGFFSYLYPCTMFIFPICIPLLEPGLYVIFVSLY